MSFDVCKLLNIKFPIVQGAMANISDSVLASAVSNAGGLGIIAAGNSTAEDVRAEIIKAKSLTDKPFGVNIMLLSEHVSDVVDVVIEEKVRVVTTGAGNPSKFIEPFKQNGITVIPVIASVAHAKMMERAGADAVVAEGMEAGGHIGRLTTMSLIPQVVDAVSFPVIAAGGIADGRGMAAAFMLGASGVQIGTRFLSAYECHIHDNYKKMILKASDIDTTVTGNKSGHPVRLLKNKMTRLYERLEKENVSDEKLEELTKNSLYKAVKLGDVEYGSVMSGQIAGLVNQEQSVSDIIHEIIRSYSDLLHREHKSF